jgi:FixJ family two-component response regulator
MIPQRHSHDSDLTPSFTTEDRRKILLLVDERDMTSLFKRMMKSVGFNVDVFNDAGQTLKNLSHVSMI